MSGLDHLWAGWRMPYIADEANRRPRAEGLSLFEGIEQSGLPDQETFIVHRGEACFVILNAYPYTSGHLMVLPMRAVPKLDGLTEAEHRELWDMVRTGVGVLESVYRPEGVNVGLNLGPGAGAGVPDHLHVHCVPRWGGDTNFMTTVAEARVLPESLGDTWNRLRAAWPT